MDVWETVSAPVRLTALIALLVAVYRSWQLRHLRFGPRGWRRGWLYMMLMAGVLAGRSMLLLIDPWLPGQPLGPVLRHPLGLAVTSAVVAIGLNGLITEMRRIFCHDEAHFGG
jgi:hypothetical protein